MTVPAIDGSAVCTCGTPAPRKPRVKPLQLMTLAAAAEYLNVSKRAAYMYVQNGLLKACSVGPQKMIRIDQADLDAFIQPVNAVSR